MREARPAAEIQTETDVLAPAPFDPGPGDIPLIWASVSPDLPYTNLGDALSPFLVSMIAGRPVHKVGSRVDTERMASVGTIGQNLISGKIHLWGTGFDAAISPIDKARTGYIVPPKTEFVAHAVRGKNTAALLRRQGVKVPEAYGDPAWFMPRFFPLRNRLKQYELGVILHLSELTEQTLDAGPRPEFGRYRVPPALKRDVIVMNTFAERSIDGLRRKIALIVSCKRIVSMSLHGLVLAETYGIPCAWFGFRGNKRDCVLKIGGEHHIDHRVADFYSGVGRDTVGAYVWHREEPVKWERVMKGVDKTWLPLEYTGRDLFDAFPFPTKLRFGAGQKWPIDEKLLDGVAI